MPLGRAVTGRNGAPLNQDGGEKKDLTRFLGKESSFSSEDWLSDIGGRCSPKRGAKEGKKGGQLWETRTCSHALLGTHAEQGDL